MFHRLGTGVVALFVLALVAIWGQPVLVSASVYGSGKYNECSYGCSQQTPGATIARLPSGLAVSINVRDGQPIPKDGYDIIISPLDGTGNSFKRVDFYINGNLVHSQVPAENGTLTWRWNPARYAGTNIRIVVTDTTGHTWTRDFTVSIVSSSASLASLTNPENNNLVALLPAPVTRTIQNLPAPVVYSFPYLLLSLLGLEVVVLLWQSRREISSQRTLRGLLVAQQDMLALKRTFLDLVSHYLRTPITLIRGGAEGLPRDGVAPTVTGPLQVAIAALHTTVEEAIGGSEAAVTSPAGVLVSSRTKWSLFFSWGQKILVALPVVLVGFIASVFIYVVNHATRFTIGSLTVASQLAAFMLLASAVYLVFRRLHLYRVVSRQTRQLLSDQALIHQARDILLASATQNIAARQAAIVPLAATLPTVPNAKFIRKGLDQLQIVIDRCVTASQLKGGHANVNYQATSLAALYEQSKAQITSVNQSSEAQIQLDKEVVLASQDAPLLALVLGSVLDNALAYSPAGEPVTVAASVVQNHSELTVHNNGSGIAPDKLTHLFEPFYKAEGAEVFTHEGMGFSLYLDKLIMQYLGGNIALTSEPGHGVTTTISWPTT